MTIAEVKAKIRDDYGMSEKPTKREIKKFSPEQLVVHAYLESISSRYTACSHCEQEGQGIDWNTKCYVIACQNHACPHCDSHIGVILKNPS